MSPIKLNNIWLIRDSYLKMSSTTVQKKSECYVEIMSLKLLSYITKNDELKFYN